MDLEYISSTLDELHEVIRVYLRRDASLLDIGCGNGTLSRYIVAYSGMPVTAFEEDGSVLSTAKELHSLLSFEGDITYTSVFPQGEFGAATMLWSLHHDKDNLGLFRKVREVLTPFSPLIVFDYNLEGASLQEFLEAFSGDEEKKELRRLGEVEAYYLHTKQGISECISNAREAGFYTNHVKLFSKNFVWVGYIGDE